MFSPAFLVIISMLDWTLILFEMIFVRIELKQFYPLSSYGWRRLVSRNPTITVGHYSTSEVNSSEKP